ncbi:MAG: biotin/lipoyl-binding protein, partial [Saprospiraceae bacterium]|nr:biotin/lipoyl-binding protein [Saprospiraceae bacterium]MCB0680896.1 biotin/lipoyl-binding protein [Saprospiraceae bacterium]
MEDKRVIRSEEVQEILGTPPSWIVQWGTTVVLISLVVLGALSWYFKYPDKVSSKLTLTTLQPPVPIFAKTDGYISRVLVQDGDSVQQNAILAVIASGATYEDVLKLEADLQLLQGFDQDAFLSYEPDRTLQLGEMQSDYASFVQLYQDFSFTK